MEKIRIFPKWSRAVAAQVFSEQETFFEMAISCVAARITYVNNKTIKELIYEMQSEPKQQ